METDYLIRFDYAIKHMLRDKANFGILEGFIEVFLGKKCKIVEILESEGNQDDSDDKYNRVDIKARVDDGEIIIVEVQTTRYTAYLERILYGVSKAVTEQLDSGKHYANIKQVFSISIVYYDFGVGDDYFYECKSEFIGVHTQNTLQLSRREELTVEEITKIRQETGKEQQFKYKKITSADVFPRYFLIRINAFRKVVADAMDEWMDFLKNNSIKADTTVPGLAEAREKLLYARMSPEERFRYDRRVESLCNERDALSEARNGGIEEGIKKGIQQGREEGRIAAIIENVKNMLNSGIDFDTVVSILKLQPDIVAVVKAEIGK